MAKANRPYATRRRIEPRAYDFARLRVRSIHVSETGPIIAFTLSESDLVLVGVAIGEAYQMADLPLGAVVQHPVRKIDGRPVLDVHIQALPSGLSVGHSVNLSAVLVASMVEDTWIVAATAKKLRIRREKQGAAAPISMPHVGSLKPPPTDAALAATLVGHIDPPGDALDIRAGAVTRIDAEHPSNAEAADDRLRVRIVRIVSGPPNLPRKNAMPLGAVMPRLPGVDPDRVQALLDEAVDRGELLALRRSCNRGGMASRVTLYAARSPGEP